MVALVFAEEKTIQCVLIFADLLKSKRKSNVNFWFFENTFGAKDFRNEWINLLDSKCTSPRMMFRENKININFRFNRWQLKRNHSFVFHFVNNCNNLKSGFKFFVC